MTEIGGYQIRLDLDASGDDVDYQLSSTPARSPNDILAMLLTGQSPDEFGGAQSMAGDLPANYFGTALGEFLLTNPERNLLGVTRFNISPTVVGPENNPAARVTVGQRLDDKTMLIYSRDLSAEGDDLYRVERQLNRTALELPAARDPAGLPPRQVYRSR